MTGRVLSGPRHELVISTRIKGHTLAILAGAALAAVAVFGWGV